MPYATRHPNEEHYMDAVHIGRWAYRRVNGGGPPDLRHVAVYDVNGAADTRTTVAKALKAIYEQMKTHPPGDLRMDERAFMRCYDMGLFNEFT